VFTTAPLPLRSCAVRSSPDGSIRSRTGQTTCPSDPRLSRAASDRI
jgi:hypothetical protein